MRFRLGFIGAGAMAEAIIQGVLKADLYKPHEILASDINSQRLEELKGQLAINTTLDNSVIIKECAIIILAVKPHQVLSLLAEEKTNLNQEKLLISIAAGISTTAFEQVIGDIPLIRVMPNTPSLVGAGMSALAKGSHGQDSHLQLVDEIFSAIGETVIIEENLIDAVTGVSGSGPAYVYQFIEAMADGGVQVGIPRAMAYKLAAQTVVGAGLMVLKTGMHPGQLKDMVTSPGGTTIRAINVLEQRGVRAAVMDAVEASCLWSKKISEEKN